jgi:hypothetical protein
MFVYTNPNPIKRNIGDCVIRAIAIATDSSWEKTYMDLCAEGLEMADLPNSNAVWSSYLKRLGFRKGIVPDTCPDCYTVADFAQDNPYGIYVLCTGSHTVTIVDGNIFDAWDSSSEIPIFYYYKED